MTMHKRRSLFVTGILLSALVLFGSTAAFAQVQDGVFTTTGHEAAALDHDSIRIRWAIDVTNTQSSNIEEFQIRYQEGMAPNEAESWEIIEDIDEGTRTIVVDELDHSTDYVFQVRALDPDHSVSTDTRTAWLPPGGVTDETDLAEVPEQVDGLDLVPMDMMIMASWDEADTDSDFPLTGYELRIEPEDGNADVMNIGVMTTYTFEGLTNGTEYTVTVAARNEIGLGDPSDEEMATPIDPPTPTTPTPPTPTPPTPTPPTPTPPTPTPPTPTPPTPTPPTPTPPTPPTPPTTPTGAPQKVEVRLSETMSTDTSITFSWVTPGSGTSALIDYQLEYKEAGKSETFDNNFIPPNGRATQDYTIPNLAASTTYEIRLRAQNRGAGYGEFSDWFSYATKVTPSTPSETGTPGAPQKVVIRVSEAAATTTTITFSWVTPGSGLSALIDYQLEYNEVGRSDTFTNNIPPVAGATQEYTIAGLKVGAKYQIRLRAQNRSQGYGLWSEWLFKETMAVPGREPSPAVSKVADPMVEAGDKMLMVSWTEPASEKSITHYMLDYKTASATKWMAKPMNVTDMKYTIDGLINGTAYLVRVRAVDSAGNMGEWSDNGSGTPMAGDTDPVPVPDPVPALPIFGAVALGAGLLAAGRARLRRRELRAGRVQRQINR